MFRKGTPWVAIFYAILLASSLFYINPSNSDNFGLSETLPSTGGSILNNGAILLSGASTAPNPCAADFKRDGDVDGADLAIFAFSLETNCFTGPDCGGDFDSDGDIDTSDFNVFFSSYGKSDCPPGAPEDLELGLLFNEQNGGGGLIAETVRIINGNALEKRPDINFGSPNSRGLSFAAAYNSRSDSLGSSGYGWHHSYSLALESNFSFFGQVYLKVIDESGRPAYFLEDSPGSYKGAFNEKSRVEFAPDEYIWYRLDGSRCGFYTDGRLSWIVDEKGNRLNLSYDSGDLLETVTDTASGRVLTFSYNAEGLIAELIGPVTDGVADGVWVRFDYDGDSNLISVTYADGSGIEYVYADVNDPHNLTEKRNTAGHLIFTWGYDDQDRCIANFSRTGKGVTLAYPDDTHVAVTDAYGILRTYTIGDVGGRRRLFAMAGPALPPYSRENAVRWEYDSQLDLAEVEYGGGAVRQFRAYDQRGNPGAIIWAAGTLVERTINYTYHPEMNSVLSRNETSVLGEGDKEIVWDYDDDGNDIPNENPARTVTRIIERGFTHDGNGNVVPFEHVTGLTYNTLGQLLGVDGPRPGPGDTMTFSYHIDSGNLLSINQPLIGATTYSNYDAAGQVGTITDVNGQVDHFVYDGRGRTTTVLHETDSSTNQVVFNTGGKPYLSTDEDGVSREFAYDAIYGRLMRKFDMDDNFIAYTYDTQGNLIEQGKHDASGARTSRKRWNYQHPGFPGRLWKEIKSDDSFTEYTYDDAGNVTSVKDPENHTTLHAYDALGRMTDIFRPDNSSVGYGFDAHGNLNAVTDGIGSVTTFIYDDMGRVVMNASPDSGVTSYVYDAAGNLIQKTDAKGIIVQYAYDELNRLVTVSFPDAAQNINYSYDAGLFGVGRLTGIVDESGNTTFEYDNRGRLVGKSSTVENVSYPLNRTFSPGGRLLAMVYPSGRRIDIAHYPNGRAQSVSTTLDGSTVALVDNLVYQPFGRPRSLTSGSGGTVNTQSGDCECMSVSNPGTPMEKVYTYDANRNLKSIRGTSTPWVDQDYTYDDLGRLIGAVGPYGTYNYTYDDAGNRLTRTANNMVETYAYAPGTNRLSSRVNDENTTTYGYDANGNLTVAGSTTLFYNQNNRLIRIDEDSTTKGEYVYNALGQRISKSQSETVTVYHYDFDGNIIAEGQPDGTIDWDYLYLGGSRTAMVDNSSETFYYYLNDHLGTPLMITDSTNTIVWEATYKPFGEATINPKSTPQNNFRFPGQYYDEESGLHYNYHRYYDPKIGRYLRADPIGLEGGMNLYAYVYNNPINDVDPFGLFRYYGFWGGPNWSGGYDMSWDELTPDQQKMAFEPIDSQDNAYMYHDKCYAHCRTENCSGVSLNSCYNRCDGDLNKDLVSIGIMNESYNELRRKLAIFTFIALPASRNINYGLQSSYPKIKSGLSSSIRIIFREIREAFPTIY